MVGKSLISVLGLLIVAGTETCSGSGKSSPSPAHSPNYSSSHTMFERGILLFPRGFDISKILTQIPGAIWKPSSEIPVTGEQAEDAVSVPSSAAMMSQYNNEPEHYEIGANMKQEHAVTEMIEKLGDTIAAAKNPAGDISTLPNLNKYLLHEIALVLKPNKPEYNTLFNNTQTLPDQYNQYALSASMKRINYTYQTGAKYSEYLTLDHVVSLAVVWLVSYISEQKGITPIVASDSVIAIMPYIIEAAHGQNTLLYELLTQLDEKMGAS